MNFTIANKALLPFSKMPIWARLDFAAMIPETYFWDDLMTNPRLISEVTVTGFQSNTDGVIWIYFDMDWITDGQFVTEHYAWPAVKDYLV